MDGAPWLTAPTNSPARVKAGKLTAISRGRKPSGPTPYGYRYDRAAHAWHIDEPAAAVVREVYARIAAGESCADVAADLTARALAGILLGDVEIGAEALTAAVHLPIGVSHVLSVGYSRLTPERAPAGRIAVALPRAA